MVFSSINSTSRKRGTGIARAKKHGSAMQGNSIDYFLGEVKEGSLIHISFD